MQFLKQLKVSQKLILLSAVSLVFMAAVGISGFVYLQQMKAGLEDMYYNRMLPVKWTNAARAHLRAAEADTFRMMMLKEPAERSLLEKEIAEENASYDLLLKELEGSDLDAEEAQRLEKLKKATVLYREQSSVVVGMLKEGDTGAAFSKYTTFATGLLDGLNTILEQMADHNAEVADQIYAERLKAYRVAVAVSVTVFILALALNSVVGMFIAQSITRPIRELRRLTAQAAAGDMTVRSSYESRDELGELSVSFNRMLEDTGRIIRQVLDASGQVAASSVQLKASAEQTGRASELISFSAQEVASGAQEQETRVQEGLDAAQQVAELAATVAKSSQVVAQQAVQTADVAQEGSRKVRVVSSRMTEIDHAVRELAKAIHILEERSGRINGIAAVMKELASQTNLLALNASIEAARAGEHGLGFAVVASEVRKLAEQSIRASQQVQGLVTDIRVQTREAVISMGSTSEQVQEGIGIVEETDRFFGQIDKSVVELASKIQEMSSGAGMMADQTVVIGTAMNRIYGITTKSAAEMQHMSAATQEQLATMEEMASSTNQLASMASDMQSLVEQFKA
ncbi:methyl-accepting chemotaxis protein [Gorillibacterium sp. sgz5001074]|uniref:methyl-accepting chemotaxis protein n=1 Tax=Gorillibacterium sp. sgz5001074 TaxID=3446695 RepID=UPI003F67389D